MPNKAAHRLEKNIDKIMGIWEKRVHKEIKAAKHQEAVALRNSLPEYLSQLAKALSDTADRTAARKRTDKIDSTRVGKKHGEDRAGSKNYTMDQLIFEYHILRQVLCDVMEEEAPLSDVEREVITCSIEQAVNDAATEFSSNLKTLRERVSQILAHDLRNPLTSTKIAAQIMLRRPDVNKADAAKLNLIVQNMDRQDNLITELLDASKLSAGQVSSLEFNSCDLNEILKELLTELNMAYPDCFKVDSAGECKGHWNEDGLRRMIENLITNAVKYGEVNSLVTILLTQDATSATLSVHNNGKPIPHKEQSGVFEHHRRASSSDKVKGWGLGLTMVKSMVDAHQGTIKLESEAGMGTKFTINIPKAPREECKQKEYVEEPSGQDEVQKH